jgi:hypothetical protein
MEQYDPVDELLWLQRELGGLEQKYGISSEECFQRFHNGQMGDDPEIFNWVSLYKGFQHLKSAITEALERVAAEPQAV